MLGLRVPALATLALLCAAASAHADGLPVGNVDVGPTGVTVPGSATRIVAVPAGSGRTLVARTERDGGSVLRSRLLRERLTVPAVALDGTAGGLSGDGASVALIRPRIGFPRRRTTLAVLDARTLQVRRRLALRGDFSFDAISRDGRRLFLVQYVDPRDPRAYVVRSYDVRRGRFDPEPIVDAREPDEDMRGYPQTRVESEDGRWAFTLYDGGGEPFVHALDTAGREARCLDLPITLRDQGALRLRGDTLTVTVGGRPAARIDTRTWNVSKATAATAATPARPDPAPKGGDDGHLAWLVLGGVLVAGCLAGVVARLRRRRAPSAPAVTGRP